VKVRHDSAVPDWRQTAFDRFSTATELPMLVLTIVMVPVLIIPLVNDTLPSSLNNALEVFDYFIWGIFAVEYAVRVVLAPRRWHFVTHHPADLVVVLVPMLRPLRVVRSVRLLRFLRLARLGALAQHGVGTSRRSLHAQGLAYVVVITGVLVLMTSLVVFDLEREATGSTIKTWPDGLWWALTTVTTVGYGDKVPVTPGGRAVAVVLMLGGIALLSVITAAIAATFIAHSRTQLRGEEQHREEANDELLTDVVARMAALETAVGLLTTQLQLDRPDP
jgi:voltage-gated potassium channel